MTTLTIQVPEKEKAAVLGYLKQHGVKIQEPEKQPTRKEVLADLEKGLKEVKAMSEGKLNGKSLKQILNAK
jgi:hypothetical protein